MRFSLKHKTRKTVKTTVNNSFNPLFWGFLWNVSFRISDQYELFGFQSSFLRFSLKLEGKLRGNALVFDDFQSSFLRFSLKHYRSIGFKRNDLINFQSSFLRFSLKLELYNYFVQSNYKHVFPFNPLFWGFLWNLTFKRICLNEFGSFFQSSFLRFSLKLCITSDGIMMSVLSFNPLFWGFLWNFRPAIFSFSKKYVTFNPLFWGFLWNWSWIRSFPIVINILSILFFEVFFETGVGLDYLGLPHFLAFNPLFWGFLWNFGQ